MKAVAGITTSPSNTFFGNIPNVVPQMIFFWRAKSGTKAQAGITAGCHRLHTTPLCGEIEKRSQQLLPLHFLAPYFLLRQ
jgi:hypothetical protein